MLAAVTRPGAIAVTPLLMTTYSGLFESFVAVIQKESLTGALATHGWILGPDPGKCRAYARDA